MTNNPELKPGINFLMMQDPEIIPGILLAYGIGYRHNKHKHTHTHKTNPNACETHQHTYKTHQNTYNTNQYTSKTYKHAPKTYKHAYARWLLKGSQQTICLLFCGPGT